MTKNFFFLTTMCFLSAVFCLAQKPETSKPAPVIYFTDLYHPHGDPDDHFDLACLFSLAEQGYIDIKGVVIDYPPQFRRGDPALAAVAQLNRICALNVPTIVGCSTLPAKKGDTLPNLSKRDAASINWIIETLRKSGQPVAMVIVGSATDVAVAAKREPELFRQKCSSIYLNSGATHQPKPEMLEWNVKLNPAAYSTLFELTCPLYWFPCWSMCEERKSGEWGTFYWLPHSTAFDGVSIPAKHYFWFMFSRSSEPFYLRNLMNDVPADDWNKILKDRRGMWSTASLLTLAGQTVTKTGKIVPIGEAGGEKLYQMEPVKVLTEDNGRVKWEQTNEKTQISVFHVLDVPAYPDAMSTAVQTLLRKLPEF
ncbi:MAG: nucleoside hydrolase [Planctomycetaceae bacterium]|nr:nucleoside hydrolase [Planctomycetaceae bacterium]